MKENDIREDMNGIKFEILRDDEERKKDQLKRLQAYVEAIQKKVSSHTDQVVKELVAERHRQGLTQSDIADRTGMKASNICLLYTSIRRTVPDTGNTRAAESSVRDVYI